MRRTIIALAVPVFSAAVLLFGAQPALAGGGGCHLSDSQGTGTTVELTSLCFSPTILYVQPGATVTWKNQDGLRHLVVGSLSSWPNGVATLEGGQSTSRSFPTTGIFPYSCPLHYGMNGVVIVGDGNASVPLAGVKSAAAARPAAQPGTGPWPVLAILAALAAAGLGYLAGRRRLPNVTA